VAATLDGEATVKRFKREDGHVWLLPRNPAAGANGAGGLSRAWVIADRR
jgi:SOS-response transcriptional repressor LexA